MAKRVQISTKTTRNKEFNSYKTGTGTADDPYIINTVTSTTANTKNGIQNIKLLDVNEAIKKTGEDIISDSLQNTTLIEVTTGFDAKTAKIVATFALLPSPPTDPVQKEAYDRIETLLEVNSLSYAKIKNMIIDYSNDLVEDESYYIFGAPEQVVLNNRQTYNNCGIESTLNTLAMAGIIKMSENLKDQSKVEKSFLKSIWERNLADDAGEINILDEPDGGTLPDNYRDILEYYNIDSTAYYITSNADFHVYLKSDIKQLAYQISQGYGAVLGVCSDVLWNEVQSETGEKSIDHAVAITGVVYNKENPTATDTPVGFYIHDTGAWMTRFITYEDFLDATLCDYLYAEDNDETVGHKRLNTLKEYDSRIGQLITKDDYGIFVTITNEPVKVDTFNLNVTGDKYANMLWGNNSNNVINGMKGDDTLYGRGGNDTIRGGDGSDIIVGNEVMKINATVAGQALQFDAFKDFESYLIKAGVMTTGADDPIKKKLEKVDYKSLTGTYADITALYKAVQDNFSYGINDLYGDAGNDIIIGGEQADLIYGGKGNDYIYGGDGRNAIYGGAGNDVIIGGFDNDKLIGDAGSDVIFGLDDDDVLDGGAGNDNLYGGGGNDTIETGKGNDNIYFEGKNIGQDTISSKGGTTLFKFMDDGVDETAIYKGTDMFFSLKDDEENNKVKHLGITFSPEKTDDTDSKIDFKNFFTIKSGKTKSLYIDAADGIYNVAVSKKATATVANTKMTESEVTINGKKVKQKDINNVLLTTWKTGTKITTSDKNDHVTMLKTGEKLDYNYDKETVVDTITYTKGNDKYVSEERNTEYIVTDFDSNTNLSIYDNVIGLTKTIFDEAAWEAAGKPENRDPYYIDRDNCVSTHDSLKLNKAKSTVNYLFDVGLDGTSAITTENTELYLLNGTNYADIVKGSATGGFIYMDSVFKFDPENDVQIAGTDFYGNGQIENIYYNSETAYANTTTDLTTIASNVASWLTGAENTKGYTTAFEAFANAAKDEVDITNLIAAYNNA